jgi:hypothetical protein
MRQRSWLRYYPISQKVDSSTPDDITDFLSNEVKSNRRVRLTTPPPSLSRLSSKCEILDSHNPMGFHGLLQGQFLVNYCVIYNLTEASSEWSSLYVRVLSVVGSIGISATNSHVLMASPQYALQSLQAWWTTHGNAQALNLGIEIPSPLA